MIRSQERIVASKVARPPLVGPLVGLPGPLVGLPGGVAAGMVRSIAGLLARARGRHFPTAVIGAYPCPTTFPDRTAISTHGKTTS